VSKPKSKAKLKAKHFRLKPGEPVDLSAWPTRIDPPCGDKAEASALIAQHAAALSAMQEKLYASRQYALLIILQGMDTAGKDGAIRHVMSGIDPEGCEVTSFGAPSEAERRHDFLWRCSRALPARGVIGIFNRSYYEETLVVRVHPQDLAAEGETAKTVGAKRFWRERYRSILDFEAHLTRNGTRIVKIFLHISKEEQRRRLLARIDEPQKTWKLSPSDIAERRYWDLYQSAYQDCLSQASSRAAPWHVVPADDKETARLIVSQIILEAMESLDLAFPTPSEVHQRELLAYREELAH
jgi:PPK2 family polyphosphate:nucleotide phosphotransferase